MEQAGTDEIWRGTKYRPEHICTDRFYIHPNLPQQRVHSLAFAGPEQGSSHPLPTLSNYLESKSGSSVACVDHTFQNTYAREILRRILAEKLKALRASDRTLCSRWLTLLFNFPTIGSARFCFLRCRLKWLKLPTVRKFIPYREAFPSRGGWIVHLVKYPLWVSFYRLPISFTADHGHSS